MSHKPKGFILSGGPNSVYDSNAPGLPGYVLDSGLPVLGICYGMQLLTHHLGGQVAGSKMKEYGPAALKVDAAGNPLFEKWQSGPEFEQVWMSHGDHLTEPPPG